MALSVFLRSLHESYALEVTFVAKGRHQLIVDSGFISTKR
jgi:hypothetical protein